MISAIKSSKKLGLRRVRKAQFLLLLKKNKMTMKKKKMKLKTLNSTPLILSDRDFKIKLELKEI